MKETISKSLKRLITTTTTSALMALLVFTPLLPIISFPQQADAASPFDAIWADDGQMPIFQEDRPASHNSDIPTVNGERYITPQDIITNNPTWDGTNIIIKGAKNEVVEFNLMLEGNNSTDITGVSVAFDMLTGPGGYQLKSKQVSGNDIFDYVDREIELFYIKYPAWEGSTGYTGSDNLVNYLSMLNMRDGFNQGLPQFRYDYDANTRPNWHKHAPDIALPIELINPQNNHQFTVERNKHQAIWADIYIPRDAPSGSYTGTVSIKVNGQVNQNVPVQLTVRNMTLSDEPTIGDWVIFGIDYMKERMGDVWNGEKWVPGGFSSEDYQMQVFTNIRKVLHRHRVQASFSGVWMYSQCSGISTGNYQYSETNKDDCLNPAIPDTIASWHNIMNKWYKPYLNGTLFTQENKYEGPGENTGANLMALYPYFSPITVFTDGHGGTTYPMTERYLMEWLPYWDDWFAENAPKTEFFYYLLDETVQTLPWDNSLAQQIDQQNATMTHMQDVENVMKVFKSIRIAYKAGGILHQPPNEYPYIDMWYLCNSDKCTDDLGWQETYQQLMNSRNNGYPDHGGFSTNGTLPGNGSFMLEGSYQRASNWINQKFQEGIKKFHFMANIWSNDAFGSGPQLQLNFWEDAHTHGTSYDTWQNEINGYSNYEFMNGDGLLLYPGIDQKYVQHNYGIAGAFSSTRLKKWRRGVQDAMYIRMARKIDRTQADNIIRGPAPRGFWETHSITYDQNGNTSTGSNELGFSTDSTVYTDALDQLAVIIEGGNSTACTKANGALIASGDKDKRVRFQSDSVSSGQKCNIEHQVRVCNNGLFGGWSGSYQNDTCEVQGHRECSMQDGTLVSSGHTQTRTRYGSLLVQSGQQCNSQEQTRTCNDGQWTQWDGQFTRLSCHVQGATCQSIGGDIIKNGDKEIRTKYRKVTNATSWGVRCWGMPITRTCNNGTWSDWEGWIANVTDTCTPDENISSCTTGDGTSISPGHVEERIRYKTSTITQQENCQQEVQTRICANGSFREWSGDYTEESCTFYMQQQVSVRADINQNNTLETADALLVLKKSLQLPVSTWPNATEHPDAGDVNCSNSVTVSDALLVLRKSLTLPVQNWCDTQF